MSMIYLLRLLLLVTIVLGLAACGGSAPGGAIQPTAGNTRPTAPPEPTGAPQPAAKPTATEPARPTSVPQPTGVAGSAIVIYHKSGGIMGLDETLTVHEDGTLVLESRGGNTKTAQVRPDQLDKLRELIASPEFAQLQAQYRAMGADLFTYDITVPGGKPGHVVTMDGVENPQVLIEVLQELSRLRRAV
jgi:hypothetical protein